MENHLVWLPEIATESKLPPLDVLQVNSITPRIRTVLFVKLMITITLVVAAIGVSAGKVQTEEPQRKNAKASRHLESVVPCHE